MTPTSSEISAQLDPRDPVGLATGLSSDEAEARAESSAFDLVDKRGSLSTGAGGPMDEELSAPELDELEQPAGAGLSPAASPSVPDAESPGFLFLDFPPRLPRLYFFFPSE